MKASRKNLRNSRRKTRKQRGGECEQQEVDRCKSIISKCASSAPAAAGTVKNDPLYAPWFKKLSMGIPAGALSAKMKAEGLNPALLNTPNAPAPTAEVKAPAGISGFLSGILGGPKLKKAAVPNAKPANAPAPAPEKKANPLMNEMAERLRKRAAKPSVFVDPALQKVAPQESSSTFKNELVRKVQSHNLGLANSKLQQRSEAQLFASKMAAAKKRADKAAANARKASDELAILERQAPSAETEAVNNAVNVPNSRLPAGWKKRKNATNTWYVNPQGESLWNLPPLPEGWTEEHDEEDTWYESPTGVSQWIHPGLE